MRMTDELSSLGISRPVLGEKLGEGAGSEVYALSGGWALKALQARSGLG